MKVSKAINLRSPSLGIPLQRSLLMLRSVRRSAAVGPAICLASFASIVLTASITSSSRVEVVRVTNGKSRPGVYVLLSAFAFLSSLLRVDCDFEISLALKGSSQWQFHC